MNIKNHPLWNWDDVTNFRARAIKLEQSLADMVRLIDHLKEYPKCNARKFLFRRDGNEHGTIQEARNLLTR